MVKGISNLLRLTAPLPSKSSQGSRGGQFEMPFTPSTGSNVPKTDWLHYAENGVVPLCRKRSGGVSFRVK